MHWPLCISVLQLTLSFFCSFIDIDGGQVFTVPEDQLAVPMFHNLMLIFLFEYRYWFKQLGR